MATQDMDSRAVEELMEDAGRKFGSFVTGFMTILENASVALTPVLESMLVRMSEAWAERVVEKNT